MFVIHITYRPGFESMIGQNFGYLTEAGELTDFLDDAGTCSADQLPAMVEALSSPEEISHIRIVQVEEDEVGELCERTVWPS